MHTHYKVELFGNHEHLFGVKTEEGEYYTLLRTSLAEALFVDGRLHEKDLVISGRVFPRTQLLEVTRFLSIRDGVSPRSLLLLRYVLYPYGCTGELRLLSGTGCAY